MRMLTICSSKRRPERIIEMIESFYETRSDNQTKLVVYLAGTDPMFDEYKKAMHMCEFIVGKPRTMPQVLNYISTRVYPDVKYYHEINDDHIYRSKNWDSAFIDTIESKGQGWGVACGRDIASESDYLANWNRWQHPSGAVFSGNLVRALDYIIYPQFIHIGCDDYVRDLAKSINRLFQVPEVFIEHIHWVGKIGNEADDPNYPIIYSDESRFEGMRTYHKWQKSVLPKTKAMLVDLLKKEGKNV